MNIELESFMNKTRILELFVIRMMPVVEFIIIFSVNTVVLKKLGSTERVQCGSAHAPLTHCKCFWCKLGVSNSG